MKQVSIDDFIEEFRGKNVSFWAYTTTHKPADMIDNPLYFHPVASRLTFGDRILVNCKGTNPVSHFTLAVTMAGARKVKVVLA